MNTALRAVLVDIMLGDTPYDIEAARRAGVGTIILRRGGWWNDDAFAGGLAICDHPDDLPEAFDESVPGSGRRRSAS